jgi:hypothetical protein
MLGMPIEVARLFVAEGIPDNVEGRLERSRNHARHARRLKM